VNIILFGPPGAGKGTQADNLSKKFKLFKISTGDLLREEIKKNTTLGNEIKNKIDKKILTPNKIIYDLINKVLGNKNFLNRLIFDGFPRTLSQATNLESLLNQHKQKLTCVLSLNVDKDTVIKRILGRQTCSKCGLIFNQYFNPATKLNHSCESSFLVKRDDDNEKTIINRYDTYIEKTLPILDFYKKQSLLKEINGTSEINLIYKEIEAFITSLET